MRKSWFGALAAVAVSVTPAMAQQDADIDVQAGETRVQVEADREEREVRRERRNTRAVARAMRVSDLMELEVRGAQNEEIGQIKDIVLDLQSGRVRYAALAVGGVLGVGDELFAVPWNAFRVQQVDDEWVAVIDATAESFENAPGFNPDNWPDFADPTWRTANDLYYSDEGLTRRPRNRQNGDAELRLNRDRPEIDEQP